MEGSKSNPIELVRQIRCVFEEHKQAWSELPRRPPKIDIWQPPSNNWIKLNFDAAIREEEIFVAIVGRDDLGKLVFFCCWINAKVNKFVLQKTYKRYGNEFD